MKHQFSVKNEIQKIDLFNISAVTSNRLGENSTIISATVLLLWCEILRKLEFINTITLNLLKYHKLPHYMLKVLIEEVRFCLDYNRCCPHC